MTKKLTPEERFALVQKIYSATSKHNRQAISIKEACEQAGLPVSTYYRWKTFALSDQQNLINQQIPQASRKPKFNNKCLKQAEYDRIEQMARSGNYKNPNQIALDLKAQGSTISANTVRNYLEKIGLYVFETFINSDGKKTKKKVLKI